MRDKHRRRESLRQFDNQRLHYCPLPTVRDQPERDPRQSCKIPMQGILPDMYSVSYSIPVIAQQSKEFKMNKTGSPQMHRQPKEETMRYRMNLGEARVSHLIGQCLRGAGVDARMDLRPPGLQEFQKG